MSTPYTEEGQTARHFVAGMLSTIDYTPSEVHPASMLNMADRIIHHVRLLDSDTRENPGEVQTVDRLAEPPF